MKITISKTDVEAEVASMHHGYKETMLDPRFGQDDGHGNIVMDADRLHQIRAAYKPQPGQKPMNRASMAMALTPTKAGMFGAIRLRTVEEKAALMKICQTCEKFKDGWCNAAKCCSGRQRVKDFFDLNTTDCPLGKFPKS